MTTNLPGLKMLRGPLVGLMLFLVACATTPTDASNGQAVQPPQTIKTPSSDTRLASNEPLLVAAAANVQFAFVEIGQKFTEKTGQPVEFSFGSSGNLATQIENGAPFDLFVAANVAFVDRLNDRGLIFPETQRRYAQGRIVLATNHSANVQVASLEDLLDPTVTWVVIANPELAPYGQAAKEALQSAGIWEELQPKLVLAESVGQALQFVQTGDAPAGIIALAIAGVPEITYTVLPANLHAPLDQSMAVVKSTQNEAAARAFLEFVTGPDGQAVLDKFGFQSTGGF